MTDEKDNAGLVDGSELPANAVKELPEVKDDAVDEADPLKDEASGATAAHGFLSELETRLRLLKEGVIRFDDRQIAWLHAKAAELRAAL